MAKDTDRAAEQDKKAQRKREREAQQAAARALVAGLRDARAQAGFTYLVLARLNALVAATRGVVPGSNVVDEALALAGAHVTGAPHDVQRIFELVGVRTGHGVAMCWLDPDARAMGDLVDLALRSLARPDQAAECAARAAGLALSLVRVHYQDGEAAARSEEAALRALADLVARGSPLGPALLASLPPLPAGPTLAQVQSELTTSFGAGAAGYRGPKLKHPFGGRRPPGRTGSRDHAHRARGGLVKEPLGSGHPRHRFNPAGIARLA